MFRRTGGDAIWLAKLQESDPEAAALAAPAREAVQPEAWLGWIWRAWWRLHHDRPQVGTGMGMPVPGRIAWRDIVLWCEHHGHGAADIEFMSGAFQAMDDTYLTHWREEQEARQRREDAARPRSAR